MNNDYNEINKKNNINYIVEASIIAALYISLTIIFKPISFGYIQVRIAEILTIMPIFFSSAIPGLFVGCLIANIICGAVIWDVILGSIATLLGACLTYLVRKKKPVFAPIGPVLANTIILPIVLYYFYGIKKGIFILAIFIFIGEFISCGVLGLGLYNLLIKINYFKSKLLR